MVENSHINSTRILKNTIVLYFRMLFITAISIYTSRVVLNTLGIENYGIYQVVGGIVIILSFLNSSMAGATQRFLNFELGKGSLDEVKRVFATSKRLHLMIGLAIVFICETLGLWYLNAIMVIPENRLVAANWVYQFSIFTFFITIISVPYNSVIIAHEKMSIFAYFSVLEAVFKLGSVYLLTVLPADRLITFSILNFFIALLLRLIYNIYSYKVFPECKNYKNFYDTTKMKEMFGFSSWTVVGSLGAISHTQGIAVVINYFFGVTINAAQGIANQVNGLVSSFVSNFMTAANPQLVKSYATGDVDGMTKLLKESSKMALFLVSLFSVPLIIETPFVLNLWLGQYPNYTVDFIRLILLISLCNAFASPFSASMGATGKIRNYQLILTTLGWFHVPLTILCYSLGTTPIAAMYVYLFLIIIMQNVRIYMVGKVINMRMISFYKDVIIRVATCFFLSLILSSFIKEQLPISAWSSLFVMLFSGVINLLSMFTLGLSKQERAKIMEHVLNRMKK